jgi:hypothetical protein
MDFYSLKKYKYNKFILLAGLILSAIWVMLVDTKPFSDFQYYYDVAVNVANGLQWGNTYTAVGYSIILGGLFKIFGASLMTAKVFNVFLITLNSILFIEILDRADLRDLDVKIIFTLFVLFPNNIFYAGLIANELLFTTFLLICTLVYLSSFKYKYAVLGILTGINTIIKPFFIVFFFAVFLVDLLKDRKPLAAVKNSMIVLLLCCLTISPWVYRNTRLIGEFTYVSNNSGIVLYINNNSQNSTGKWMDAGDVENSVVKTQAYQDASMTGKNKMLSAAAKQWISSHPREFLNLGMKRLENTFLYGDDIFYSMHGSALADTQKYSLYENTNKLRKIIFEPAILCILIYSIIILRSIFRRETDKLNRFNLYSAVLFYMFSVIYFATEGQGRYAFPMIFIFVYFFYLLISSAVAKLRV